MFELKFDGCQHCFGVKKEEYFSACSLVLTVFSVLIRRVCKFDVPASVSTTCQSTEVGRVKQGKWKLGRHRDFQICARLVVDITLSILKARIVQGIRALMYNILRGCAEHWEY